ncbi:MAG TPA: carboxypeptidase-like regulatory domain-containing protein, partial [Chitinophagaceae bacterium]|nr:carboxypeptidase-like regulatory domain-containing protein [Chitinophagaceae bacterium]
MKNTILLLFFISSFNLCFGQSTFTISGKVRDAASNEPLAFASVFCQNTTLGTTTNKEGSFSLNVKNGGYDLVITYTGYRPQLIRISPDTSTTDLLIAMVKEEINIEEVVIRNTNEVKNGWEKYGAFFLDNFIGSTPYSTQCFLLNPEVLTFYYSRRADKLKVLASEPLLITNNALGYNLRYHLDSLVFDYKTDICSYLGYSFYEEKSGRFDSVRLWKKNREKAYNGSRLHFMHSYFDSTLTENGFVLAELDEKDNTKFNKISDPYDPDYFNRIDSLNEKEFFFPRRISITYTKSHPENEYLKKYNLPISIGVQTSYIDMLHSITIRQNGYFYEQKNWINYGYWSWKNIADQV